MVLAAAIPAAAAPAASGPDARQPASFAYPSDSTVAWRARRLAAGETLERVYGARWLDVAGFNRMDRRHARAGTWIRDPLRLEDLDAWRPLPESSSEADTIERFVLIDVREQFLGAYERGQLVFAAPITTGRPGFDTRPGLYRIGAAHERHRSSRYTIEGTSTPYPMDWGLRLDRDGPTNLWIHGRDLPGRPVSHGCIGLTDELMQHRMYGAPARPEVSDARRLFAWAVGDTWQPGYRRVAAGPIVRIVGVAPRPTKLPLEGVPLASGSIAASVAASRAVEERP